MPVSVVGLAGLGIAGLLLAVVSQLNNKIPSIPPLPKPDKPPKRDKKTASRPGKPPKPEGLQTKVRHDPTTHRGRVSLEGVMLLHLTAPPVPITARLLSTWNIETKVEGQALT
eukprot:1181952-Prorocentrum_minimum.AAC.5